MNQILEAGIQPMQWVLLAIIVILIILYPIFVYIRNKKDREKFQQLNDNLKVGDKVITGSGVYGTIVSLEKRNEGKIVTIETGDENHKGYLSIDVLAIYNVVTDEPIVEENNEIVTEEDKHEETVENVEAKEEITEPVIEEPKKEKKPKSKKN